MKRILWLIGLAAAVWGLPRLSHPAVDVGKLDPVETLLLTFEESGVTVETDTGKKGQGSTFGNAVEDLYRNGDTEIFLDTTANLLISGEAGESWEEIYALIRPSCRICKVEGSVDLKKATEYLSVHKPNLSLNRLRSGLGKWETLRRKEGGEFLELE